MVLCESEALLQPLDVMPSLAREGAGCRVRGGHLWLEYLATEMCMLRCQMLVLLVRDAALLQPWCTAPPNARVGAGVWGG